MILDRRCVTRDTLSPLIKLDVRPDQRDLVSSNLKTLAEAPYAPGSRVWGLWAGPTPVGLMAMVDPAGVRAQGPVVAPGAAYLWRLMIAADQQGKGYGMQAVAFAIQTARDWHAPRLVVGVSDAAHGNRGFYECLGFRDSGTIEDDDRLFVLDLPDVKE